MKTKKRHYIEGLADRLRRVLQVDTDQEIAEILGENNNTFNHYLTGRNKIPYDVLVKIYQYTKRRRDSYVNLGWLLTGEGPEFFPTSVEAMGEADQRKIVQDYLLKELLRISKEDQPEKVQTATES